MHALVSELKMRIFLWTSLLPPKHTIDSIHNQPLEHHFICILIDHYNSKLLVWEGGIVILNTSQKNSDSIGIIVCTM